MNANDEEIKDGLLPKADRQAEIYNSIDNNEDAPEIIIPNNDPPLTFAQKFKIFFTRTIFLENLGIESERLALY